MAPVSVDYHPEDFQRPQLTFSIPTFSEQPLDGRYEGRFQRPAADAAAEKAHGQGPGAAAEGRPGASGQRGPHEDEGRVRGQLAARRPTLRRGTAQRVRQQAGQAAARAPAVPEAARSGQQSNHRPAQPAGEPNRERRQRGQCPAVLQVSKSCDPRVLFVHALT